MVPLVSIAALLGGCRDPVSKDAGAGEGPPPWTDLDPVELDPFRPLVGTTLDRAEAPERLFVLDAVPATAVLDAGALSLLDQRYHHDPLARCVDASRWPHLDDGQDRQGDCAEGEVSLQRGRFAPRAGVVWAAPDADGSALWAVDAEHRLYRAGADPLTENPLDHLRFVEVGALAAERFAVVPGGLLAAGGSWLFSADREGSLVASLRLPGDALDLAVGGSVAWVATAEGLVRASADLSESEVITSIAAERVVADEGGAWVALPAEGAVARVEGSTATRVEVAGLVGPLARQGDALVVVTADGLAWISGGAVARQEAAPGLVDVAVVGDAEIVGLFADRVQVWGDETALGSDAPLHVAVAAFVENPKNSQDAYACRGEGETMEAVLATATRNHALLAGVPATTILGLTPEVVRRSGECDALDTLAAAAAGTVPGVLFHEEPAGGDGYVEFLTGEIDAFAELAPPAWASGLSPHDEVGVDWVPALEEAGGPDRFLFFGMSLLPEVPHEDPRAKDPLPFAGATALTGWATASAEAVAEPDPAGTLAIYPGNNVPGFFLGQCANLFVRECDILDLGGGATFDEDDVAGLALLLFRALAHRSASGPDTWSFHLPALGLYDYTEGCAVSEGIFSGCEAALLQEWLFDVHARYVSAGLVEWTDPRDLPWPGGAR